MRSSKHATPPDEPPVLTVGLPLYQSRDIAWLALEGLAEQRNAPPWELLIVEEQDAHEMGSDRILSYMDRLQDANCVSVAYKGLDKRAPLKMKQRADRFWVPLSVKWAMMGKHAAPTSKVFLLQGGDDHPPCKRLARTYEYAATGMADWIQWSRGMFYDIQKRCFAEFDLETPGYSRPCGVNMSVLTEHMRALPNDEIIRGVDGWLFTTIKKQLGGNLRVMLLEEPAEDQGLFTDGCNTISTERTKLYDKEGGPFKRRYDQELGDYVNPGAATYLRRLGDMVL